MPIIITIAAVIPILTHLRTGNVVVRFLVKVFCFDNKKVSVFLWTSLRGIGRYLFKHSANHETQYAFNNTMYPSEKIPISFNAMSHAIFCLITVMIGV